MNLEINLSNPLTEENRNQMNDHTHTHTHNTSIWTNTLKWPRQTKHAAQIEAMNQRQTQTKTRSTLAQTKSNLKYT